MKSVRLIVAGVGLIGLRHLDAMAQVDGVELVGLVDPQASVDAIARNWGCPRFDTLSEALDKVKPDGVVLATPTLMHVAQGLEAVNAGCAILVEKPIAATVDDAKALVDAATRQNVPLLVGHHRRHNPLIRRARALIDEGRLGNIRAVQGQCWFYKPEYYFEAAPWRKQKGAGPISVNLVHDIDLIRYLCGDVVTVQAQASASRRGYENEDVAAAVLRFKNDAIGTITVSDAVASPWSWEMTSRENPAYSPVDQSCYQIGGDLGSLSIPDMRLWSHGETQDWMTPIAATSQHREISDPLVNQIRHFAKVITGDESPLVSGLEGLKTLQVIEAMQTAASTQETLWLGDITGAVAAE